MTHRMKNRGTRRSATIVNLAYKPSWSEKVEVRTHQALAADDVNDLRPLRGALSRVIDIILASAQSQLWGADAPRFLKKGDNH